MAYQKTFARKDINTLVIGGNVGRIQDLRYFENGDAVLNFTIACSDDYKKANGEIVEQTIWIECAVYGKRAEGLVKVLPKAKHVTITAKLMAARGWSGNNGIQATNVIRPDDIVIDTWKDGEAHQQEEEEIEDVPF